MSQNWWQLSKPSQFIESTIADLRNGMNVILRSAPHTAPGILEALKAKVRENELWRWRQLDAVELPTGSVVDLSEAIHQVLRCRLADGHASPQNLAQSLAGGDIICVENIKPLDFDLWTRFLAQYQHACHQRLEDQRGLFCIPFFGILNASPVADIALSIRTWTGRTDRLDQMIFLNRLLVNRFKTPILHRVALSVATELMGADPQLGIALASAGHDFLIDPIRILREVGGARGWSSNMIQSKLKEPGLEDVVEEERQLNSAALALNGKQGEDEIWRRVWSGQVSVLFPFIEEQRIRIVHQVKGYLDLPLETTFGRIDSAFDLEVGELVYFLRGKQIPDRIWTKLQLLKDLRHTLAHLRPVPPKLLLSSEFAELSSASTYA